MNGVLDLRTEARAAMPALPELDHLRDAAIATWRGRMLNEHASARVFEALAAQLARAGLDADVVAQCASFAPEERRHGVMCGAVVQALGGEAIAAVHDAATFPEHHRVGAMEGALRNVLSVSCLSETVAVALIGAERLEMPPGSLRDLLTRIWSDEVGHARFGWVLAARCISALDADARERMSRYLAVAFEHLERHELAHLPLASAPPAEGAALGLCSGADARTLFYATVHEVIVPRLDQLGLRASEAWRARSSLTQQS